MDKKIKEKLGQLGVRIPRILLPKDPPKAAHSGEQVGFNWTKWAVVACDQYTSEPEYWQKVENYINGEPSTYKVILPEVYLGHKDKDEMIKEINKTMADYLNKGILEEKFEGMVLTERTTEKGKRMRHGLIMALDLEKYDYTSKDKKLIMETEGTVESRIPPRLEIRKNAAIELPHIMVLIDDPSFAVLQLRKGEVKKDEDKIYDFELMMGGGHIKGWKITSEEMIKNIANSLEKLISREGVLFAMGDGNHSMATAKAHWQNVKKNLSDKEIENHPARFALVEVVNLYDDGLVFEPIHRVIMRNDQLPMTNDQLEKIKNYIKGDGEEVEIVANGVIEKINIKDMGSNLIIGDLQILLDKFLNENVEMKIDYIHGKDAVEKIVNESGGIGFLLESIKKEDLFPTVIKNGVLPRKAFSMGEAEEKRFYLEARKIVTS